MALQQRILPEIDWRLQLMKAQWTQQSLVHGVSALAANSGGAAAV